MVVILGKRQHRRRSANLEIPPPNSQVAATELFNITHSPFHLTNSDNSGLSIVSEVLDGKKYDNWCIVMTKVLDEKNKFMCINGSIARPIYFHHSFRIWSQCYSMVKSWTLNSGSKNIYKSNLKFNDTLKIWKDISTRFHITNFKSFALLPGISTNLDFAAKFYGHSYVLYYFED